MLNWLSEINYYQKKEKEEHLNRLVQLATVSQDNSPRVRTVVFRGWTKFNEMKVISDNRSKKIEEIKSNNYVEICWFFPTSMCQFRLRGRLNIDMSEVLPFTGNSCTIKQKQSGAGQRLVHQSVNIKYPNPI